MDLVHKDSLLKEIFLFAGLSSTQLNLVSQHSSIVDYKKGQIIYQEGSAADAFYCVLLGRVVIYTQDQHGNEKILEYLHRGKYFGIISLLTGDAHSVTARAMNDSALLVIKKADFDFLLKKIPVLAVDLSHTLSRRLKNKDIHKKTIFESTVVSVYSSYSHSGKTMYVLNLALSLRKETPKSVIIIDVVPFEKVYSLPAKLDIDTQNIKTINLSQQFIDAKALEGFILKSRFSVDLVCCYYNPEDESCVRRLLSILSIAVNDYNYIILDLPSTMDPAILGILNQSDIINILTSPEPVDLKRTRSLIERLCKDFDFQEAKVKVIINEYKFSKLTHQQQVETLNYHPFATLPKIEFSASDRLVLDNPDSEYAKAVRRISRQLGETQVGLALGVGFAYGFCHIGVLKVIEEEKIPIDVITGSSIGALIAALWACGMSSDEILEFAREFKKPKNIWRYMDFTLPFLSFIKGNKFYALLRGYLGKKTFHDVKLPLKIIASDVKRKEPRIIEEGLLTDAIMASCAMPGLFRPFQFQENMLCDGGISNPLPTEVLFKMGVKKIIAVNVTPSRQDLLKQYAQIQEEAKVKAAEKKGWPSLKTYLQAKFRINILDIIFSSIEVMQSEMAQQEAKLADIVLHPDTRGLHWVELHKAEDFAKRGEEEARKNLDKIWQMIKE